MATPQQQRTAKNVRGYSKAFLAAACTCTHPRVDHVSRTKGCTRGCGCEKFAAAPAGTHAANRDPREVFLLGTVGASEPAPAPALEEPEPELAPEPVAEFVPTMTPSEWEATQGGAPPAPPPEPAVAGTLVPREGTASRCPFCMADDFETIPSLKCPSCKAWQHAACVTEHKKCAACSTAWPA